MCAEFVFPRAQSPFRTLVLMNTSTALTELSVTSQAGSSSHLSDGIAQVLQLVMDCLQFLPHIFFSV